MCREPCDNKEIVLKYCLMTEMIAETLTHCVLKHLKVLKA